MSLLNEQLNRMDNQVKRDFNEKERQDKYRQDDKDRRSITFVIFSITLLIVSTIVLCSSTDRDGRTLAGHIAQWAFPAEKCGPAI